MARRLFTLAALVLASACLDGPGSANVSKIPDGNVVNVFPWDRYALPNGPHDQTKDFGAEFIALLPGEGLRLSYYCSPAPAAGHLHVQGQVWYRLVDWNGNAL